MPRLGLGLGIDKQGLKQNPIIPSSLQANALALYTTRPSGLSDFAVDMENKNVNGDFSNGTTGYVGLNANISATSNICDVLATAQFGSLSKTISASIGDVLMVGASFKTTSNNVKLVTSNTSGGTDPTHTGSNTFEFKLNRCVATTTAPVIRIRDDRPSGWNTYQVKEVFYFNLTTIFGLGNEPTTTEFSDMLTYKGKTFWNGTEKVVINPNDKYYWPDRSGNGRHLHLVNVAYDATGGLQVGPPANYLFDGVNDYAVFNSATNIVESNGAVSGVVVFQATTNPSIPFILANSLNRRRSSEVAYDTGKILSVVDDLSLAPPIAIVDVVNVSLNNWICGVSQYNPVTKKTSISTNGNTLLESAVVTNGTSLSNRISVSALLAPTSVYTGSRVSELYFFNKVLTQSEITSLIKNLKTRYGNIG